jgi:hypothetical protein
VLRSHDDDLLHQFSGRWRDADEFEPDFRSIRVHQKVRVLQKRLGR